MPVAKKTTQPSADPAVTHEPIALGEADDESPMITLFTLNGVDYQIPARPRANLALRQLALVRELGPSLANVALLEELLGADAFAALAAYDGLKDSDLARISTAAMELTMGALEEAAGN